MNFQFNQTIGQIDVMECDTIGNNSIVHVSFLKWCADFPAKQSCHFDYRWSTNMESLPFEVKSYGKRSSIFLKNNFQDEIFNRYLIIIQGMDGGNPPLFDTTTIEIQV